MPKHSYTTVPTELSDFPPASSSHSSSTTPGWPRQVLPPSISTGLHQYASAADADEQDEESSDDDSDYEEKRAVDAELADLRLGRGRATSRLGQWAHFVRRHPWFSPLSALVVVFICLIVFLALHVSLVSHNYFQKGRGPNPISMEHAFNGSLNYRAEAPLQWISQHEFASKTDDGGLEVHNLQSNATRLWVSPQDIKDERGRTLEFSSLSVSQDQTYLMLFTQARSVFRHSTLSDVYIHHLPSKSTSQLGVRLQSAQWAPTGHHVAYVKDNDVYVKSEPDGLRVTRVSETGGPDVFNGVADWVYEEEIFGSSSALWWSPDGSKLIYATFDDSQVPEYSFPLYSEDPWFPGQEKPYTSDTVIKYPKPGYPNPTIALHLYDLASDNTTDFEFSEPFLEPLLVDVAWITPSDVLVKRSDRLSVVLEESHFDLNQPGAKGSTVRQTNFKVLDGGWYEPAQTITPFYSPGVKQDERGYLDLVLSPGGYKHIAYFAHAADSRPVFLTEGNYEVVQVLSLDWNQKRIWFVAANPSTTRRLFWIPFPDSKDNKVQEPEEWLPKAAYVQANFSPLGDYIQILDLSQQVPWQALLSTVDSDKCYKSQTNSQLAATQKSLQMPQHELKTLEINDTSANVLEIRPPNFDASGNTHYPVLFRVYGGPGSVTVNTAYQREFWHEYLASTHHYIVVLVDGKGTGLRGRKNRAGVHGQLGQLEVDDQLTVARYYASLKYVDPKRLGIWGWSFGGYLTSKVIEANAGLYSLGMAVAPVIKWEFYDSVYTERYMGSPSNNAAGYAKSAVTQMDGFKNTSFYLAAGSGDDNVHFLHSATLLDYFTFNHVRDFRFRMFTDSAHSMMVRGARIELYQDMTSWLVEQWGPTKPRNLD